MSESEPCPFCNGQLKHFDRDIDPETNEVVDMYIHPELGKDCPLTGIIFKASKWNFRPIEKTLRENLADANKRLINIVREVLELKEQLNFHARAAKLMRKRKPFVVIANDEPYFKDVYNLIRDEEIRKGRWSTEDEELYLFLTSNMATEVVCPHCGVSTEVKKNE